MWQLSVEVAYVEDSAPKPIKKEPIFLSMR